jgi:hypothetical protein
MTNVPAGARLLLDFIGKTETGRAGDDAYLTIIGHREGKLSKPLTAFTIDELLAAQKLWIKNWRGSAAGKYQILRKTLLGIVAEMGLEGSRKFTPQLQDAMGFHLLKRRGWGAFASGQATVRVFGHNLAKEWASIPVLAACNGAHGKLKRGQSYYDGDGVNSALVSAEAFEAVLLEAQKIATQPIAAPAPAPPAPKAPPMAPFPPTPIEPHEEPIAAPPMAPKRPGILLAAIVLVVLVVIAAIFALS